MNTFIAGIVIVSVTGVLVAIVRPYARSLKPKDAEPRDTGFNMIDLLGPDDSPTDHHN